MRTRGFTVIELLVTLIILAMIATATPLALPRRTEVDNAAEARRVCRARAVRSGRPLEQVESRETCFPDGSVLLLEPGTRSALGAEGDVEWHYSKSSLR